MSARIRWVLVFGYAGLIFAVSSIPAHALPGGRFWDFDKFIHGAEYGVLGGLLAFALRASIASPGVTSVLAWALATLYGVTDELHQGLVPGRFSSAYDALADSLGAALVAVLWWCTRRRTDTVRA